MPHALTPRFPCGFWDGTPHALYQMTCLPSTAGDLVSPVSQPPRCLHQTSNRLPVPLATDFPGGITPVCSSFIHRIHTHHAPGCGTSHAPETQRSKWTLAFFVSSSLVLWPRIALNARSYCPSLQSAGVRGQHLSPSLSGSFLITAEGQDREP